MKRFVFTPGIWCLVLMMMMILPALFSSETLLPTSCREVVYPGADNPIECARVTRSDIGMINDLDLDMAWDTVGDVGTVNNGYYDTILKQWVVAPSSSGGFNIPVAADGGQTLDVNQLPGSCRWDMERSNCLGNDKACMCPATKYTCAIGDREGKCWWHQIPEVTGKVPTKACLNNAERFYYLLDKLLKKRGKSDFAIKLKYASDPMKSPLPLNNPMLRRVMMINMMGSMMKTSYLSPHGQSHRSPYGQPYRSSFGQSYRSPYGQSYRIPYGQSYRSFYGQPYNQASSSYSNYNQQNATQPSTNPSQTFPTNNFNEYYLKTHPSAWSHYQRFG